MRHQEQTGIPAEASENFEWVNAWAAQASSACDHARPKSREARIVPFRIVADSESELAAAAVVAAASPEKPRDNQMVLDILAIMRARDALARRAQDPAPSTAAPILVKAHRTGDSVPIVLGSVMGLLMVIVFSAVAAFVKLAR